MMHIHLMYILSFIIPSAQVELEPFPKIKKKETWRKYKILLYNLLRIFYIHFIESSHLLEGAFQMSEVKKYVDQLLEEKFLAEQKPVRFSVSIDNMLNFRLQYVAKILGTQRASLAADFLSCAVMDAEKALGIQPFNFNTPYGKELLEATGGAFYQDDSGYYRVMENGEKIKIVDREHEEEVDYTLGRIKVDTEAIERLSKGKKEEEE